MNSVVDVNDPRSLFGLRHRIVAVESLYVYTCIMVSVDNRSRALHND